MAEARSRVGAANRSRLIETEYDRLNTNVA
jgi:hypothetical protein